MDTYAESQVCMCSGYDCATIGVILGGTRGTRTPHFLEWGYRTPHFLRAVTRKITTQIQAFNTEQDTNCQIAANSARRLLYTHAHLQLLAFCCCCCS